MRSQISLPQPVLYIEHRRCKTPWHKVASLLSVFGESIKKVKSRLRSRVSVALWFWGVKEEEEDEGKDAGMSDITAYVAFEAETEDTLVVPTPDDVNPVDTDTSGGVVDIEGNDEEGVKDVAASVVIISVAFKVELAGPFVLLLIVADVAEEVDEVELVVIVLVELGGRSVVALPVDGLWTSPVVNDFAVNCATPDVFGFEVKLAEDDRDAGVSIVVSPFTSVDSGPSVVAVDVAGKVEGRVVPSHTGPAVVW